MWSLTYEVSEAGGSFMGRATRLFAAAFLYGDRSSIVMSLYFTFLLDRVAVPAAIKAFSSARRPQ